MLDDIQIPLKYFSCSSDNTELIVNESNISLLENGQSWMGLNLMNKWQAYEFVFELSEAQGVCVTTGLGLGVIQTLLLQNPKVTKVIVYEKNQNVINIFLQLVEKNNFDISKLEIVNLDADSLNNVHCDCMFLDHFEHESDNEIVSRVKCISEKNTCKLLWYWPGVKHFTKFCISSNIILNNDSFYFWKESIGIKKLPNKLTDLQLKHIRNVRDMYYEQAKNREENFKNIFKNKLLNLFGSKK
jgi:hypothetical protein